MKETALAHSNIAFIKYWGKSIDEINVPNNDSLSVNLSNLQTTTTVEFDRDLNADSVTIDGETNESESARVSKHLDHIRTLAKIKDRAKVVSENNFPKASGLASSASGFAALTVAATSAAGLSLSEREMSTIARLGSGSASRSIPPGYVIWHAGKDHESSYAESIYPPDYWDIDIVAVILSQSQKSVGSTEGHGQAQTSPLYQARIQNMPQKVEALEKAMAQKDFERFGQIVEQEAFELHAIALTSTPPILYWLPESIAIMKQCHKLREEGIQVYFTFDAGPQPILFCQSQDTEKVKAEIEKTQFVQRLVVNKPAGGTVLTSNHLF